MRKRGFIYDYLVWFIAYYIGIRLGDFLVIEFDLANIYLQYGFIGLIILLSAKIMQMLVFDRKIKLNKSFIFWWIAHSLILWGALTLQKSIDWAALIIIFGSFGLFYEKALRLIIVALFQTIGSKIVYTLNIERKLLGK